MVSIISFIYIAASAMGIIYHAVELKQIASNPEVIWVLTVRLLAIAGGVFALRSANWARWLLVAWIIYHVIISFYHSTAEIIMHAVVTVITIASLYNAKANTYFRNKKT